MSGDWAGWAQAPTGLLCGRRGHYPRPAVFDAGLIEFVLGSLPPPPARVLEVGAGNGQLAETIRGRGYDVVAIDPASTEETVRPVALHELDEPDASFDCACAVMSMHHVAPLGESCQRLAELVRPGAPLVLDELDVERFDTRAARWWLDHRTDAGDEHDHDDDKPSTPEDVIAYLRHHCHPLELVLDTLAPWFELWPPERGAYLYRWARAPELRTAEEELIRAGQLMATGARIVGRRN